MTWLLEDPWTIGFAVLALGVIGTVVAAQISRGAMLLVLVLNLLLGAGLLITERLVVTEREQVADTLYRAADGIMSGDPANVLPLISEQARHIRGQLKTMMSAWQIETVKLGDMKVTINRLTPRPTARATFKVRVEGSAFNRRQNVMVSQHQILQKMVVNLEEQAEGQWLIVGYDIGDN